MARRRAGGRWSLPRRRPPRRRGRGPDRASLLCVCVVPDNIAATVTAATPIAGRPSRAGVARIVPPAPLRSVTIAATTASAPRAAQTVSANCGASDCSRPSIHEMPDTRVTNQATTAPPLTTAVAAAAARPPRTSVTRPTRICAAATATNSRDRVGCSAWIPTAAAWMAPAPTEASPCSGVIQPAMEGVAPILRSPCPVIVSPAGSSASAMLMTVRPATSQGNRGRPHDP